MPRIQNILQLGNGLNKSFKRFSYRRSESLLSILSIGFLLILVGTAFAVTPNFFQKTKDFLNFEIVQVPNTEMHLPAPESLDTHSILYSTIGKLCFAWGLFTIVILMLRFIVHSPLRKKAETGSSLVFWFGASFLIHSFLNEMTTTATWFTFWAAIITLTGASLIAKAFILAAAR